MKTVVPNEHDDSMVSDSGLLKAIDNSPNQTVHKADAGVCITLFSSF